MGWNGKRSSKARAEAFASGHKPLARSDHLIVEELGDEVLVYDSNTDTAHCLSPDAARVWRACDGGTSVDDLPPQVGLSAELVESALDELERCELLERRPAPTGHTRRDFGLKIAKVSAAAASVPLIVSVAAPAPAAAVTPAFCFARSSGNCGTNTGCTRDVGCCCCTPPIKPPYPAGEPCAVCGGGNCGTECKSCVPCDQDDVLCPTFCGSTGCHKECSAGDQCRG